MSKAQYEVYFLPFARTKSNSLFKVNLLLRPILPSPLSRIFHLFPSQKQPGTDKPYSGCLQQKNHTSARRLRPLARRLARTLRPPLVAILALKPQRRALTSLEG